MILTVIQARMSSTRLPGKILLPIAGKSILQHVIDAAPEPKVVAMPLQDLEDFILHGPDVPDVMGDIVWYDGDINDVLSRFYHAWRKFKPEADWILRICADCPMLTKRFVNHFLIQVGIKYEDTIYTNRPYDPDGSDMELFSVKVLKMAHEYATDLYDREHVTPWIYRHFNVFRESIFDRPIGPENPEDKCSVDTLEDYEKVKNLMEKDLTNPKKRV